MSSSAVKRAMAMRPRLSLAGSLESLAMFDLYRSQWESGTHGDICRESADGLLEGFERVKRGKRALGQVWEEAAVACHVSSHY